MEQILKKVHNVDPKNSDEVKEALTSFFQCISKYKELHSHRLLRELQIIINRFPKYCLSYRSNIETFLIIFLSSSNFLNVIEAGKCANALQQVRPSTEKSATPKTSWRDLMNELCNAAHTLIGSVYSDAVEVYRNSPMIPKHESTLMSAALVDIAKKLKDVKDKQSLLQLRLKNILVFIQAMLVEMYPVAKPVQPQTILDVIVRLLSVTSGSKKYDEDVCTIKIQTLRTLDALIVCLGSNLIPYSPLVFRLVLQTLRWSSDHPTDHTSKVRCTAYNSLSNWLTTLHSHRISDSNNTWEDSLTDNIIKDITPVKKVVELTMGPQPTKHMSKKAKRKLVTTQLQESNIATYAPGENNKILLSEQLNNEIAIAALECAEIFLTVCGRFLKPTTYKLFQECLVRECYNYSSYSDEQLLGLLRALEATRKTAPNGVPPATQYCLHLYSLLHNSRRAEISKFCSQSLLDIRLHLHCSPPSLNFALDVPREAEQTTNNRKKVSDRNRAMLQSLLEDKVMPSADNDDVISIPDEPSSKKLRLESSDTDKISILSSDSEGSVEEICDDSENDNPQEIEVVVEMNEIDKHDDDVDDEAIILNEEQETELTEPETPDQDTSADCNNQIIKPVETNVQINVQEITKLDENELCEKLNGNKEEIDSTECMITDQKDTSKNLENVTIYEAQTQLPTNVSIDTIEEVNPLSSKIGYDPNKSPEKVAVLDGNDDENLFGTNDTDDIQITCGQDVKSSQEVDLEKKSSDTEGIVIEILKVNGLGGTIASNSTAEKLKVIDDSSINDRTTVEDMLADFVDEVNEEVIEA